MITPKKLFQLIDPIAPVATAMPGDPCGLIIDTSEPADKILVALDFTADVAEEACAIGAKIVVTHHPIIYHPLKNITRDDPAAMALAGGISVISLHTCWDRADGGITATIEIPEGVTGDFTAPDGATTALKPGKNSVKF